MRTKEEYESLLNNARLFEIDKATLATLYKAEHYFFLNELTDYYRFYIYPDRPLDSYSMPLVETAVECIKYYNKSKGEFLHLFNKVMKRNLSISRAQEKIDEQRRGIKLANRDAILIRKILAFADNKNLDLTDAHVQEKIAAVLDLQPEAIAELIDINYNATAVSSTITNEDGDEIELYDMIVTERSRADKETLSESALRDAVDKIECVFVVIQDRQKKIVSMLLTAEIIKALDGDVSLAERLLCGRTLFSSEIVELCRSNEKVPSARSIGELCGVSEQSVSRTYGNFKEKLRRDCRFGE